MVTINGIMVYSVMVISYSSFLGNFVRTFFKYNKIHLMDNFRFSQEQNLLISVV